MQHLVHHLSIADPIILPLFKIIIEHIPGFNILIILMIEQEHLLYD